MNERVTVREAMSREFVGVSESDTVAGAAALMHEDGVEGAVVLRGSTPVGILRGGDVIGLVAGEDDPAETRVGDAMTEPPVVIDAGEGLPEAVRTLVDRDVRRAVVTDDDEVVGVLSADDVVAVTASRPPEREAVEAATAESVGAAPGEDVYNTQSVCEVCGSLARDLADVNGQLVCVDCRSV